jgi:phospholipid/cholesterol/gamma-HCH transport system permease protein
LVAKVLIPIEKIGRAARGVAGLVGGIGILLWRMVGALLGGRVTWKSFIEQAYSMGAQSVPLVTLTGMLSGVVTSQQGGYQFNNAVPLWVLGSVVTSSVILELGPVVTAIVIIGRVGSRITAEIGTMKVSEQLDALHALGRDPVAVLAAPRLLAGMLSMPLLVLIADGMGMLAGLVAANLAAGLSPQAFLYGARIYWNSFDVFYSASKALAFGFTIPLIASQMGFLTEGGAEGVGRATTRSVVLMILSVLVLDALFPPLLLTR